MNQSELIRLARVGAEARLAALRGEIDAILKQFPQLRSRSGRVKQANGAQSETSGSRRISAAGRKRIADAARRRWAEWRAKRQGGQEGVTDGTGASASRPAVARKKK